MGVYPEALYSILPYAVDYQPYTTDHVLTQLQLLFFALLSFAILARNHLEPPEVPSTIIDTDWIYRKALPAVLYPLGHAVLTVRDGFIKAGKAAVGQLLAALSHPHRHDGLFSRTWTTSGSVLLALLFLGLYFVYYASAAGRAPL